MAILFDIKRFAIHDGPGIRTTVFFKGCPLRCTWCHNPESIDMAICRIPKTVSIGYKLFTDMETVGYETSVSELMIELQKEKIFMDETGGGVTFSGGEPLMQHSFLIEALEACKAAGMHTVVDTSGYARWELLAETAQLTDMFLYDLKLIDDHLHREHTGVSNKLILGNIQKLSSMGKTFSVRMPMIPGITFTDDNICRSIDFLRNLPAKPESVDLLPFHNTASHKYERFGITNIFAQTQSLSKKDLEKTKKQFEEEGFTVKIGG